MTHSGTEQYFHEVEAGPNQALDDLSGVFYFSFYCDCFYVPSFLPPVNIIKTQADTLHTEWHRALESAPKSSPLATTGWLA
jgi:hypothetical protein